MYDHLRDVSRRVAHLRSRRSVAFVAACMLASLSLALGQAQLTLPQVEGESLAGKNVNLPAASSGKVAILIFGFSKASKTPTTAWAKKLYDDFSNQPQLEIYQLPVLESVPRLVRGMVISSMKGGVPENRRDHFVPILHGESDLKKLVNFREPDDAYLVLLDPSGRIIQQTHGPFDQTRYSQLQEQIRAALKAKQ